MRKENTPILIDTDIGDDVDDTAAIIMALNSPELDVLGITTVYCDTVKRAELVLELCALCGRDDIPVYAGAKTAIVQATEEGKAPIQYGILRESRREQIQTGMSAAEFMVKTAAEHPGLVIVEMGMMTNLALAFLLNPEIMKTARILAMGGEFQNACPEWNIMCDPEAARIVTDRAGRLEMVGLELTKHCTLPQEEIDRLCPKTSVKMEYFRSGIRIFQDRLGYPVTLHDVLLTAYLLDERVLKMEPCDYTVELQGNITRGSVVKKLNGYAVESPVSSRKLYYARSVWMERFYELVNDRLY